MNKTEKNLWKYKVGINAIIANFVCIVKKSNGLLSCALQIVSHIEVQLNQ